MQRDQQADDEQDETMQQFARDLQDLEERMDGYDTQLDALEEEKV